MVFIIIPVFRVVFENLVERADGTFHLGGKDCFLVTKGRQENLPVVHRSEHLVVSSQGIGRS